MWMPRISVLVGRCIVARGVRQFVMSRNALIRALACGVIGRRMVAGEHRQRHVIGLLDECGRRKEHPADGSIASTSADGATGVAIIRLGRVVWFRPASSA